MRNYVTNPAKLPLRANIFAAGATCSLATNSKAVIDSLTNLDSRAGISPRSFQLNVFVDSSLAGRRRVTPHFRGLHHFVFAAFAERELFVLDLERGVAFGVVSNETAEDRRFWTALMLPIAVGVLGTTIGIAPVHAACLDRNGKGLMVAGLSGAGKSTLAVALSQQGFSLVSDDWTYVARDGKKLRAYGLRAPVKLLADAARHFPELGGLQPAKSLNGEMAFEVDASQVFGTHVRFESNPNCLLFLERVEQPGCDFIPFSREAARDFFEASAERLPTELAHATAKRSEIIDELTKRNCWLLQTGCSPADTAAAVSRFCEGT